ERTSVNVQVCAGSVCFVFLPIAASLFRSVGTLVYPPPDLLRVVVRVPRSRPDRKLAPAALPVGAAEPAPRMPLRQRTSPAEALRVAHGSLDLLVRVPGPGHRLFSAAG